MKILKLIFCGLLISLAGRAFSQSGTSAESTSFIKPFAVGIHLEQFKIHDSGMYSENVPSNKIIFTINPSRSIRIEPEFGFNYFKRTAGNTEHKNRFVNMGLGTFGQTQFNRLNIYYGARFEYNIQTSNGLYSPRLETIKINYFNVGPAIGCEYFVVNQITFGGEFGLKYGTSSSNVKDSNLFEAGDQTSLWTDTGLFLRFYF